MRAPRKFESLFLVGLLVMAAVIVVAAQQPRTVDDNVLANAAKSGEEWVSYNQNWMEQRYSPLTQINTTNVSKLGLAFSLDIPAAPGNPQNRHEGTPLVFNGALYSITPWSVVYAVDARTGKELWHQDPGVNQQVWASRICCGVVNRGIAIYKDKIIAPVVDGRLRALDVKDGKVLWEVRVSPENMPYTITMAPRVIKGGKVIVGVSGGEYGVRGFFSAYDAETGQMSWRFYTVPGDPSKPFESEAMAEAAKTWDASKEWWKLGGGGGVWGGIAYDPDVDIVYVSTGQPAPWTSMWRGPGDNLYTDSILAVRGATGKLVWYYQEVPGDDWDLDSIADLMLADLQIGGKTRNVIMHAPKNGFFYVLDRRTGELLSADPWVAVSWAAGVNMKTGRPIVNPEAHYGTSPVSVMPGPGGGHVWPPMSFSPKTGLVYIPSTSGGAYTHQANPDYVPLPVDLGPTGRGQMNMGTGAARGGGGGGGGGRGGAGAAGGGAARGGAGAPPAGAGAPPAAGGLAPGLDPVNVAPAPGAGGGAGRGNGGGGGRGGGGNANAGPPQPSKMLFLTLNATPIPGATPAAAPAAGRGAAGANAAPAAGARGATPAAAPAAGRGAAGANAAPAAGARGAAAAAPPPAPPGAAAGANGAGARGGGGGRGGNQALQLPAIGPTGLRGNYLIAWDPVAQKEKWHGPVNSSAGFNQGGTLATAGNLVFGVGNNPNRLVAYAADTGKVLAEFALPITQMGPPMTYMIDGKQYIVISGGPAAAAGAGGAGGAGRGGAAAPAGNAPATAPAAPATAPAAGRGQRQ